MVDKIILEKEKLREKLVEVEKEKQKRIVQLEKNRKMFHQLIVVNILKIQRWHRANESKYFWQDVLSGDFNKKKRANQRAVAEMGEEIA